MRIFDLLSMCFRSLFRRKLRTFLTVIGVVIGTCSIVVMISLGVGLNKSTSDQMATWMDLTMIDVYYSGGTSPRGGADAKKPGDNFYLNDEAVEYIKSIPHVVGVSPVLQLYQEATIVSGKYKFDGQIVGMDLKQLEKMGYKIKEGRGVNETDTENTVLLGDRADYGFMNTRTQERIDPAYKDGVATTPPPFDIFKSKTELRINTPSSDQDGGGGVMAKAGSMMARNGSMSGNNSDGETKKLNDIKFAGRLKGDPAKDYSTLEGIYIDIDWAREIQDQYNKLNGVKDKFKSYQNVKVKVDDFTNVHAVEEQIKKFNFDTYSAEAQLKEAEKTSKMMQMVLGCLGGISMLVAAIGITNTMIMSIYERTREIGVMKVLGCEIKNIRTMFLCEAGSIGFMGGALGLAFSYTISFVANKIVANMTSGADMGGFAMKISIIPPWLALLGFAFSIGVGLISGFLPANRAVKISALSAIKQDS